MKRKTVRRGHRGSDVSFLQMSLKTLGFYEGGVDGVFGAQTEGAVKEFQDDHEELVDDGVVGPITWGRLAQALDIRDSDHNPRVPDKPLDAPPRHDFGTQWPQIPREIFDALVRANNKIVQQGVGYGPGRGWAVADKHNMYVTIGPRGLKSGSYKTRDPEYTAAFVCSTYTYFMACFLLREQERFNRALAGGVPPLFDVLAKRNDVVHRIEGFKYGYLGFGPYFRVVRSDGSTATRHKRLRKQPKELDLIEIWNRREELPEIMFCGQAFAKKGYHSHTAIIYIDRQDGYKVYRCAADGGKHKGGVFSGTDMNIEVIDEKMAKAKAPGGWYRCFGLVPDNLEQVLSRPALKIQFEPNREKKK